MLLQKDLKILKDSFDKIDVDKNSYITQTQLLDELKKMGCQKTLFGTKVCERIDIEGELSHILARPSLFVYVLENLW